MREPFRVGAGVVGDDLAGTEEFPFVDQETFEANRTAGVDFVGADADFGAEVVAEAVTEARAAIPEHIGGIDQCHETLRFGLVGGDDRVRMA